MVTRCKLRDNFIFLSRNTTVKFHRLDGVQGLTFDNPMKIDKIDKIGQCRIFATPMDVWHENTKESWRHSLPRQNK